MRDRIVLGAFAMMLSVTFSGCAVTEKSVREKGLSPMTQRELEERFSRPVKVSFQAATGVSGTGAYMPDGSARLESSNINDVGKWRVKDGKACFKWEKIRQGEEACFTLYKTGPREYTSFATDGSFNAKTVDID